MVDEALSLFQSRIPNGAKGRDAPTRHAVHDLLSEFLIRDDADRLRVELFDEAVGKFDHVWLAVLARICR